MNIRKILYFNLLRFTRGIKVGHYYDQYWYEDQNGIPPQTTERLLVQLLEHCEKNVPYYSKLMQNLGDYHEDPIGYLEKLPILTKDIIRQNFQDLQSKDLIRRKWFYMTSGGSTGEPGKVIHDYEFSAKAGAIQLLFSRLVGRETGEYEVYLWGSEKEITEGKENWRARLATKITNSDYVNAFRMSPDDIHRFVKLINTKKPKLITAYADAITGVAKFIEQEKLEVVPQKAIIVSATTLYPFMREQIERVFQCKVYNRYGSREIGNVACERPGCEGLWVPPWGNYLEILDEQGNRVPDGTFGEIIVTSLANYAMPLIRYRIDDYGVLSPNKHPKIKGQFLQELKGRVVSLLKTKNGVCEAGFLCGLFFFKDWAKRYQIIQKDYSHIVYRIVLEEPLVPEQAELDEIVSKTKLLLGEDCLVDIEFVKEIEASGSGKFMYIFCEIKD